MLRSFVPGALRKASSRGWFTQPSFTWTWLVIVNSSSFSGRRLPFFSTTLPMEIRPITGGVNAKPLSMMFPFIQSFLKNQYRASLGDARVIRHRPAIDPPRVRH